MFFSDVKQRVQSLKKQLNSSSDVGSRLVEKGSACVGMVYIKSMIDNALFVDGICKPIADSEQISLQLLATEIIKTADVAEIEMEQAADKILLGNVVLIISGEEKLLAVDILKYPARIPSEPPTSFVIQGPREGFTEDIRTNITLIRRRFYNKNLVLKDVFVGRYSNTRITIAFLKGIASKEVVNEIIEKLKSIDTDGIIDSHYIIKHLEKHPSSLFKQVGSMEKPDIVAAKMLEGRVAMIIDGSPIVLTLPFLFFEEVQASNDYYNSYIYSSFIRVVRLLGILIAVVIPGIYIALRVFHQNIIPIKFLITITNTTKGLPFTPFLEMLFISLLFQILYEVSLRLPSYLGLATSIVGALILGDTGVKAGLISPPGVIIVALAKIALYTVPEQAYQLTILQYLFLFIGGSVGLIGIIGFLVYLVIYLASLDSYGAPYLAPYAPRVFPDLEDGVFMKPTNSMKMRPQSFKNANKTRQK